MHISQHPIIQLYLFVFRSPYFYVSNRTLVLQSITVLSFAKDAVYYIGGGAHVCVAQRPWYPMFSPFDLDIVCHVNEHSVLVIYDNHIFQNGTDIS